MRFHDKHFIPRSKRSLHVSADRVPRFCNADYKIVAKVHGFKLICIDAHSYSPLSSNLYQRFWYKTIYFHFCTLYALLPHSEETLDTKCCHCQFHHDMSRPSKQKLLLRPRFVVFIYVVDFCLAGLTVGGRCPIFSLLTFSFRCSSRFTKGHAFISLPHYVYVCICIEKEKERERE